MGNNPVAVPSAKGIKSAFGDFAVGGIAGLLFLIAYRLFGALGIIAAPLIAGSMIKGSRGEMVAFVAGFMLLAVGALGLGTMTGPSDNDVM